MGSRAKAGLCSLGASSLTPALLPPPPPPESELSWNLDGLRADLSDLKSRGEWLGRNRGVGGKEVCLDLWPAPPQIKNKHFDSYPTTPDPTTQGLNEMRQALDSLGRLQEEVGKLWIELRASNGEHVPLRGVGVGRGLAGACARPWVRPVPACSRGVRVTVWMGVYSCVCLD